MLRSHGLQARDGLLRKLRELQAGRLARVGAEDAEAARVREVTDATAPRERLAGEQARDVNELFERDVVHPHKAGP